jgi:hypothetical protein
MGTMPVVRRPRTAIWALLALIGVFAVGLELGTRRLVVHASRIESRIDEEYAAARRIRATQSAKQVLIVGNSLLLTDVVFDSLRLALAPGWRATRLVVEQTSYFDWLYGVHALLEKGARPDVLVLMFTRHQVVSSEFRGDYTAYRLMRTADVPALARDLRLHPTVTAGYVLSTVSAFYGLRGELRKVLLSRVLPDVRELTRLLPDRGVARPFDSSTYRVARERLVRLNALTQGYGVRLLVVSPPTLGGRSVDDPVVRAAVAAEVSFIEPAAPGTYLAQDFVDGFHMNARAAADFTKRLAASLAKALESDAASSSDRARDTGTRASR